MKNFKCVLYCPYCQILIILKNDCRKLFFFNSDYSSVRMCLVNVLANYAYNYYGTVKKYIDKTEINESDEYKQFSAFLAN